MYEEQEFNSDTLNETQKSKKNTKIIIIIATVILVAIVGLIAWFMLTNNNEEESSENSQLSGEITNSVDESEASTDASSVVSEVSSDVSAESTESEVLSEETSTESTEESSEEVSEEPSHGWVKNAYGYTYLYEGAGFNQFNGTAGLAGKYAEAINKFSSSVEFPVYSMIAPTAVEFVDIPSSIRREDDFFNSSQKTFIINVNNGLTATGLDLYSAIAGASGEYLYFKTDKNWTADAAYYAYTTLCTATGSIPVPKTSFAAGNYTGYLGNFYQATLSNRLKANADTVNYYKINEIYPCIVTMYRDGLAYKDRALIYTQLSNPTTIGNYAFLGDRGDTFTITSQNASSEKSILVVGDSSAFPFVPYLVANYKNVYFINAEAYDGFIGEYLQGKTIDEAVVLSYATSAATGSYVNNLNKIFEGATESAQ